MEGNVAELERRYQALFNEYQAGKLDEATFVVEVDKLQFRDDWGRYWMLGAQTGAWHYYDGQAWHQANPHEADKLPFMDEQGRYWQKGIKSGDWYYYDAETNEWIKPEEGDPFGLASTYVTPRQATPAAEAYSQNIQTNTRPQFGADLFQDDEGRYWAIGSKTNQWYFYDADGWHPAHEFQPHVAAQTPQSSFYNPYPSTSTANPYSGSFYPTQPQPPLYEQQPMAAPPSSNYAYTAPPVENRQVFREQPGQPYSVSSPSPVPGGPTPGAGQVAAEPGSGSMPTPPQGPSQSGTWYYFDGGQWLKYSSGEPAEEMPPDPKLIVEQEVGLAKAKPESKKSEGKTEPVVAEFFEEDESPIEVVDVEVITVVEAEPDPTPKTTPISAQKPPAGPSTETAPPLPRRSDEVKSQRTKTGPVDISAGHPAFDKDEVLPRRKTASDPTIPITPMRAPSPDPNRAITPRRKAAAQEPTIIIPTGAAASNIASPSSLRIARPSKPIQPDPRRAREETLPMSPVPAAREETSSPVVERHRQVTQTMPKVTPGVAPVADPKPNIPIQQSRPTTREKVVAVAAPTPTASPRHAEPQKEGYTFGDVLRSFPSTLWTGIAGVAVMLIFAVIIIVVVTYGSSFLGVESVAIVPNLTPTLDSGVAPDLTPTAAPTTETSSGPVATPTPVSMATFSSPELDLTIEYPENWQKDETSLVAIFSPSHEGLDLEQMEDTSIRIGLPADEDASISDLLTDALAEFPTEVETLNEGTISIASQTWTSTQIRFEDENLGGQGIATIAVTNKDGQGYYLIAVAPAEAWNLVQPLFQAMINSFKFGAEETVAQAPTKTTLQSTRAMTPEEDETKEGDETEESETQAEADSISTPTPKATPTPKQTATPLVYRVKSGDTLLGIAVKFGVDMELLAQENGIESPESLQVDQELTIPFTAEELAAYNAGISGDSVATDNEAQNETGTSETSSTEAETAAAEAPAAPQPAAKEEAPAQPAAAPVSGRIVYPAFNPNVNSYDIWMVDLATGEQTPIAGNASQPAFNRDGTLLAYRSWELSTRGIFFRDFVGGRGGMVTRFVEDGLPAWAPDGYSFAFASRKEGDRVPRIYIGNQLGEDTFSVGFQGEYADTFPDGRLVVKGCTPTGDCGMFVIGSRGGSETKISGEPADTAPAVSPDGGRVAFMSSGRGASNWEIWVMNANGSNAKRLTENGNNDGLPAWSPDGKSIAYVSDQGGAWAVWVMNADGSNQRKLFSMKGSPDGKVLHDEPNSRGWLEERISWAP